MTSRRFNLCLVAVALTAGIGFAQFRPWSGGARRGGSSGHLIEIEGGGVIDEDAVRTARETMSHSAETPNWTNAPGFEPDVFTFARVIFQSDSGRRFGPRLGWWVDYPDADLNFSYRLQQLTSIRTDPDGRVLKLTDPAVFEYPLLYLEHAGYLRLSETEVTTLRRFLAAGGALFVNDFWGAREWEGFAEQIARVAPNRA